MFNVGRVLARTCEGVSRRELLQVGGLGVLGLSLADTLRAEEARPRKRSGEVSCIFISLEGGPSHLEMFDPKPQAPADVRGPFGVIPTRVPGLQVGELLPQMAQRMDRCAL